MGGGEGAGEGRSEGQTEIGNSLYLAVMMYKRITGSTRNYKQTTNGIMFLCLHARKLHQLKHIGARIFSI